jgi:hypothetical protein
MTISRRRLFCSGLLSGVAAGAQETDASLDPARHVAAAHGIRLSEGRLRILKPVLDQRNARLRALRDFAVDDSVSPRHGCSL